MGDLPVKDQVLYAGKLGHVKLRLAKHNAAREEWLKLIGLVEKAWPQGSPANQEAYLGLAETEGWLGSGKECRAALDSAKKSKADRIGKYDSGPALMLGVEGVCEVALGQREAGRRKWQRAPNNWKSPWGPNTG